MTQFNIIFYRQIFTICNIGAKSSSLRGDTENIVSDLKNPDVLTNKTYTDEIGSGNSYYDSDEGSSFKLNIKFK